MILDKPSTISFSDVANENLTKPEAPKPSPGTVAILASLKNRSLKSNELFIVLFLGASYYAPEHIEGYNPPQKTAQEK